MTTADARPEATGGPPAIHSDSYVAVQNSDDFVALRRALRAFVFPATAAFLCWYLLYVLLSAYARDFMGTKLIANINVAFVFGILQFVSTFGIAILYSRYADKKLDPLADKIRGEMETGALGGAR
jgi:uncharacterized membrane protein (DUF485 family)